MLLFRRYLAPLVFLVGEERGQKAARGVALILLYAHVIGAEIAWCSPWTRALCQLQPTGFYTTGRLSSLSLLSKKDEVSLHQASCFVFFLHTFPLSRLTIFFSLINIKDQISITCQSALINDIWFYIALFSYSLQSSLQVHQWISVTRGNDLHLIGRLNAAI